MATLVQAHAAFRSVNRLTLHLRASNSGMVPELGSMSFPSVSSVVVLPCPHENAHHLHALPHLPALKKAVLVIAMAEQLLTTDIPFHNLTDLFVGNDLPYEIAQGLLRLCPSLRRASLDVTRYSSSATPSTSSDGTLSATPTVMRHLQQLAIWYLDLPHSLFGGNAERMTLLDTFTFPALTNYRVTLRNYAQNPLRGPTLSAFGTVTSLTFISQPGNRADDSIRDCLATILDACPALVKLVASVFNSSIEHILHPLKFDPTKPRGQYLKAIVLLWDAESFGRSFDHSPIDAARKFYDLVASRRTWTQSDKDTTIPATLDRFIVRFCNVYRMDIIARATLTGHAASIRMDLATFADSGLELSFEITDKSPDWRPKANGKHWDEDRNVIQESWEFTTSMPPAASSRR